MAAKTAPFEGAEGPLPALESAADAPPAHPRHGSASAVYWYTDEQGAPLYAVCRYDLPSGKAFLQGRPTSSGWAWGLGGQEPVLFRLPQVAQHLSRGSAAPLWFCEGEKDVEALLAALPDASATTAPMGSHKWRSSYTEYLNGLRHAHIVADNDEPGRKGALAAAAELRKTGAQVRVFLPALDALGADLFDHLAAGFELEHLRPLEEPQPESSEEGPVFLDAFAFAALQAEAPEPLWGSEELCVIPAGGLCVLAGRPGSGKTTLILDLACHLAAGIAWPPTDPENLKAPAALPVPRPLRVALIENEGPQEMFRSKLAAKLERFPHALGRLEGPGGCIAVQSWRWGSFSFADSDAREKARAELDEARIDIVIGDPLASLGPAGVGSPADTRDFVALLRPLGLGLGRAFLFLHHFREKAERNEDELARISGSWGGHLDTLMTLSATSSPSQDRLAWPKLRWAKVQPPAPRILGRILNTASFEAQGEEGDSAILEPVLYELLASRRAKKEGRGGEGWGTPTELARALERKRTDCKRALEGAPHLFFCASGEAAKALGAKASAQLWGLLEWVAAETEAPEEQPSQEPLEQPLEEGGMGDGIPF